MSDTLPATIQTTTTIIPSDVQLIDLAIMSWLDAKGKRSGSAKTLKAYRDTLADFRAALQDVKLDLTSEGRAVRLAAQAWAGASKTDRDVTPATFNQRLAIVSSFYEYAQRVELLTVANPITRIERRKVQGYGSASPLDASNVAKQLKTIDRSTAEGSRDYALLTVALSTGRRVAELAALRKADMTLTAGRLTLEFKHAKGGKIMIDRLTTETSRVVLEYLYQAFGADFMDRPSNAPVWISFSDRNKGKAIGAQTIADICEKHLGTPKVHTLRHTFAHTMETAGANVSTIQAKLGHDSLNTTSRYLASLSRADNPYGDDLDRLFGIGEL